MTGTVIQMFFAPGWNGGEEIGGLVADDFATGTELGSPGVWMFYGNYAGSDSDFAVGARVTFDVGEQPFGPCASNLIRI